MRTQTASVRPYAGVGAADRLAARRGRLLDAGLDLLGADAREVSELTVRGLCHRAGVAIRYFYESFADKDEFVGAVFDSVIAKLAASTQAAVAAVPAAEQTRAGITNLVRLVAGDARVGRLLFSAALTNAVVVRKRVEAGALLGTLAVQHAGTALRLPENDRIRAAGHFAVGGVGQTLNAWLAGQVKMEPDRLIEHLTALLEGLGDPALYRD